MIELLYIEKYRYRYMCVCGEKIEKQNNPSK